MAKVSFSVQDLLGLADQQAAPSHLSSEPQTAIVPAASVQPPAPCKIRSAASLSTRHQPARGSTGCTPSPSADDHPASASGSDSEEEEVARTKRARTAYTREQLQMMELSFRTCPYPDSHNRKEIAKRLGIAEGKVQVWFQNRRAKYRKRQRPLQKTLTLPQTVPSLPLFPSPTTSSPSPTYPHLRPSPYPLPFSPYPGLKAPLPFTPSLPLPPYPHLPFPYPPLTKYTPAFPTTSPHNMYTSTTLPKHH